MRIVRLFLSLSILFASFALGGCHVRSRATVETTPIQARVEITQPQPSQIVVQSAPVQPGVTVLEHQCTTGAQEACNGLDDNCDGRIDEGCGWQSGQIQITLAWNTGADIDLYVTDPFGEQLSYQHPQSNSGGVLDHDARGACISGSDMIENVYWSTPSPPSGTYQVELHYYGNCNVASVTPTQVSISVGGRVIGVYNITLSENQRAPVAVFTL